MGFTRARATRAGFSYLAGPAFLLLTSASQSAAGGFYVQEMLDSYQGAANAGAQALGTDPSTVFHNPAAMSRLKGRQLSFGAGVLFGDVEFSPDIATPVPGPNGGEQLSTTPLLGTFYTNQLSDRLTFGAGFFSVSGAALDPTDDWAGRFQLQEVELLTLTATAGLSYQLNDAWSIGATVGVTYGSLDFSLAVPSPLGGEGSITIDGNDLEPIIILGAFYEPNDRLRVGISGFSGFDMEFDGEIIPVNAPTSFASDTSLSFAPAIRSGLAYRVSEKGTFLASVGWEKWSELDSLFVSTALGTVAVPRNWDDTYHASIGYRYQVNPDLMVQGGIAYDSSPVDAADRTADAPIDQQIRVAGGAEYRVNDRLNVRGSLTYLDFGDARIDSPTLVGKYDDNQVFILSLGLRYEL